MESNSTHKYRGKHDLCKVSKWPLDLTVDLTEYNGASTLIVCSIVCNNGPPVLHVQEVLQK